MSNWIIFIASFYFSISVSASDTKSLHDVIAEHEQSQKNGERINDSNLVNADDVYLEHEAGDEVEFENNLNSKMFEGQAKKDAEENGCPTSRTDRIVCGKFMCDFGALLGKWPSECTSYQLKYYEIVATTPPWKSVPVCLFKKVDCKNGDKASGQSDEEFCNRMSDLEERHNCLLALELNTRDGAEDFTESNGGDISALDDVEFTEKDRERFATDYLVDNVDSRFDFEEELSESYTERYKKCKYGKYKCKWYTRETGVIAMEELSFYLQYRNDPRYSVEVNEKETFLIEKGTLLSKCRRVPNNEFFNCNFYPDLPKQCWSAPSHQAIAECVSEM